MINKLYKTKDRLECKNIINKYNYNDKIDIKTLISKIRLGLLTEKEIIRELTKSEKQKIFIPDLNNYYKY